MYLLGEFYPVLRVMSGMAIRMTVKTFARSQRRLMSIVHGVEGRSFQGKSET